MSPVQGVSAGACIVTRDPVVPALFESRPVFWIVKELARRMDLGEFFNFTMEEYRKKQLADLARGPGCSEKRRRLLHSGQNSTGFTKASLSRRPPRKSSCTASATRNGARSDARVSPPGRSRGPFPARGGPKCLHHPRVFHQQGSASELAPENTLWIHPSRRKKWVYPGDSVEVASQVGKGRLKVRITEETRADTVYMDSGYGVLSKGLSKVYGKGASIVEILEDYNDEISGNMAMHETMVTVRKYKWMSMRRCQEICHCDRLFKCFDCKACMIACKVENAVPEGFWRNWVRHTGGLKGRRTQYQPGQCMQCEEPSCVAACPVGGHLEAEGRSGGHRCEHAASDAETASPPVPTAPDTGIRKAARPTNAISARIV